MCFTVCTFHIHLYFFVFFFNDTATTEIYTLSLHDALPIFENLVKGAVLTVFKERVAPEQTRDVVAAFEEGVVAHTGEDVPSSELAALVERVPALRPPVAALTAGDE